MSEFHWQYSHHYTAENIEAIVRDLKAVEDGEESIEWANRDHRTKAGILWRVISALAAAPQPPADKDIVLPPPTLQASHFVKHDGPYWNEEAVRAAVLADRGRR